MNDYLLNEKSFAQYLKQQGMMQKATLKNFPGDRHQRRLRK